MLTEVILVMNIFIDIKENADAEYSERHNMTEETANIAGTDISMPSRCLDADHDKQRRGRHQKNTGDAEYSYDF